MNYSISNLLSQRLNNQLALFEYGSGFSTQFYASLVKQVISIEYDEYWLNRLKQQLPQNAEIHHKNADIDGDYCRAITNFDQQFDIVIIDGRDRVNCIKQSIDKLSPTGVIILDDSERDRYKAAFAFMLEHGFKEITFSGLKPGSYTGGVTTVFYRSENCLHI